jgi:hypothetical protein
MDRRQFLGLLAIAPFAARAVGPTLRILIPAGDLDVRRGADMSADEARRSAAMFGGRVELTEYSDTARPGIWFMIGSDSTVIDMTTRPMGPTCRKRGFDLAPSTGLAWHPGLVRFGADSLNKRFVSRYRTTMSSAAWCSWFAVKCVWEASLRSRASDSASLAAYLERQGTAFDGHKGVPLRFDASHRLVQPIYATDGQELSSPPEERRCVLE